MLLGADPRTDFPDANLALKGLLGARFVVAVDTYLTASVAAPTWCCRPPPGPSGGGPSPTWKVGSPG